MEAKTVARRRRPERKKALELYIKQKGQISLREIADKLGISYGQVRKWKCADKWDDELKKPHRGGQPGNKNAMGHGAPHGNTNAETHGAYTVPRIEKWSTDRRVWLDSLTLNFDNNALDQYKRLKAKELDLEQRIFALGQEDEDTLHLDRLMAMEMPDGGEMKYRTESTAFSRRMQLESELNRVHGRILKLLDSMRNAEMERQRIRLEREKLQFSKQRALGIFNVNENGTDIVPEEDSEEIEIVEL
ncbi:MAG: phage terminase small subunit [Eubacteriales bacterium]|nr:phage terminase small subunit [Eubacteriales bacterium]